MLYDEEAGLETARPRQAGLTLAVDRHQSRSGYCKEQGGEAEARGAEAALEQAELQGRIAPLLAHLETRQAERARVQQELQSAAAAAQDGESA